MHDVPKVSIIVPNYNYPKIPLSNHTDCQQAESWVTTS